MALYSSCEFSFNGAELEGVWIDFKFDTFFSTDILAGYDEDKNMVFSKSEIQKVYDNMFISLKKYGFFISIRDENGRVAPEQVKDFSVYVTNEDVHYRFFVKIDNLAKRELYLSIFDPTFFCACKYIEKDPVVFNNISEIQPTYQIVENNNNPIYYDPYAPATNSASYDKWEPGLEANFPKEIHLVF